ncbi:MAG: DUF1345 domain-containing protein [Actinobacteria bacterium]|nr:DUF1345 domain-containing protein [Actinomycetota bacterium]
MEESAPDAPQGTPAALTRPSLGEPRWPAAMLIVAIITLQLLLPSSITGTFAPIVALIEVLLLGVIVSINPRRINREGRWLRALGLLLIAFISLANAVAMSRLVDSILHTNDLRSPSELLFTGGNIWLANVLIFALWYWDLDHGGPAARALRPHPAPDFLFPQMQPGVPGGADWRPHVVDYLYVSFTNSTAFSPTDTMPLSRWAKMAMMLQAAISLITLALVVARAINVLPN